MASALDVLIVGGGSAGCVVAARLAETGRQVMLLEAGPDLRGRVPTVFRAGWDIDQRECNWGYESRPNPRGRTQNVWRTKALGGTSWLTRFAVRGAPGDYAAWGPEWQWYDVLPWFKRLERDLDFGGDDWHGSDGPMPVDRYLTRDYRPPTQALIDAAEAAGFPHVDDHNRPGAVGVGRMPMSLEDGERVTTVDAYLTRERVPANLAIRCETQVARIVFDGERACGVETADGDTIDAAQVVVCAGVYANPPLLMRSGLGPSGDLRAHGIGVVADLPGVGLNLADHPARIIEAQLRDPGPGVLHAIATFRSSATGADEPPDLMLWLADPDADGFFGMDVVLLRPRSRGRVRLRSPDPADPPLIDLPALSEDVDRSRLIEAYRAAAELFKADEVRAHLADDLPNIADEQVLEDAYSLPHVVGTCAIGDDPARGAVVDAFGAVHGVEGLTIADASIMPDVPSGFTHFPTIMLAERIADRIARQL